MFATLVGAYPRTPLPGRPFRLRAAYGQLERGEIDREGFREVQDHLVRELLEEQIDAGLALLTDGQVRWEDPQTAIARGLEGFEITGLLRYFDTNTYYRQPRALAEPAWTHPITVPDWRFADATVRELAAARNMEPLPVKACLVGPYTLARLSESGNVGRERLTLALAEALNRELRALADAGAPVIQVDENALTAIAPGDDAERRLATAALERLTADVDGADLCLAVTMGSAAHAGHDVVFGAPFASHLFDVVTGPDNWRLIESAPREREIVVGIADARNTRPDDEAEMIRASRRAALAGDRGLDLVGLAPSTGLDYLPRDRAKMKIEALAAAARAAEESDPAAVPAAVAGRGGAE